MIYGKIRGREGERGRKFYEDISPMAMG